MRKSRGFSAILVSIILGSILGAMPALQVKAQSIDTSTEFVSGDVQVFSNLNAWYTWININGTRTVFLALYSNQLPSPVSAFVGQGYNSSSGSRVFVANVLLAMEVYNDTNNNGYPDANYAVGSSEIKYTLVMNASQTFTKSPAQKTIIGGVPHFTWGVTYGQVQANLVDAAGVGIGAVVNIAFFSMKYDYSVKGNTTYLKSSYEIGNVTLVPPTPPALTLQGLSLSLLHATITVSTGQLAVIAAGSAYNSQINTSTKPINAGMVNVDQSLAYEFQFNDNYTLQTSPPQSHPAVYLAVPIVSIPLTELNGQETTPLIRVEDYVKASMPSFVGLPSTSDLNYQTSKFLYRISYPTWSGIALQHDPTYIGHIGAGLVLPPICNCALLTLLPYVIAAIIIITVVATVLYRRSRHRKVTLSRGSPRD